MPHHMGFRTGFLDKSYKTYIKQSYFKPCVVPSIRRTSINYRAVTHRTATADHCINILSGGSLKIQFLDIYIASLCRSICYHMVFDTLPVCLKQLNNIETEFNN